MRAASGKGAVKAMPEKSSIRVFIGIALCDISLDSDGRWIVHPLRHAGQSKSSDCEYFLFQNGTSQPPDYGFVTFKSVTVPSVLCAKRIP
jgi:hypothetical protein